MLSVKQGSCEYQSYSEYHLTGLTRLGIKLKSTVPEIKAFTSRPSELFAADMQAVIVKSGPNQ